MKNKKVIIAIIVAILLIGVVGVAFAIYTYSQIGVNQQLVTGDIYLKYQESNGITLNDMLPSSTYPNQYFEFTITGKNTNTKYDVNYNIKLAYGDTIQGKTRIDDGDILFKLVEVVNNEEVDLNPAVVDQSFNSIPNSILYTETISKNTTSQVTHTYRLYMRISENVTIGIGDNVDYQMSDWNNRYASIKINADGEIVTTPSETLISNATPASCFTTSENQDGTLTITGYDANTCGTDVVIPNIIDVNTYPPTEISNDNENKNNIVQMPNNIETNSQNNVVKTINNENWKRVTIIGYEAFYYSYRVITSVVIPNTITTIKARAFRWNSITNVTIPDSVITMEYDAFSLNPITSLILGNNVTTIGEQAFSDIDDGCMDDMQIGELIIPNSVTTIGMEAFSCSNITDITFGNGVTTIGNGAFSHNKFKSVTIPSNVTSIDGAFSSNEISSLTLNINDLSNVDVSTFYDGFDSNGVSLTINNATTIADHLFEGAYLTSLTLGNSITTIGDYTFSNTQLTSVVIPNSVTTIGENAFSDNQLTSLIIPNSVTTIGNDAFSYNQLTSVSLGNNVTTIGSYAFSDNQLTSVEIPNSVTTIGDLAFLDINTIIFGNKTCSIIENMDNYGFGAYNVYGSNNQKCN